MTTERIDIVIREDGSRVVKRNIESMGTSASAAERSLSLLNSAIGLVGAGLLVSKVIAYADAWANAAGLIAIATKNTSEAADVTKRLFDAAQATRTSFGDVVSVYSSAARAAEALGASQNQLITFSKGLGEALAVQHVSAEQASGALLQLGQLLGSGKVKAQEFNSILMGTPVILQTVAKGLGDASGNVTELRKKMLAGNLTSKEFFEGFLKGLPALDADFKKAAFTFGQGFTLISNSLTKYIGQLNEATGASHAFGIVARTIADNMEQIGASIGEAAKVLAGFVTTFVVFKAATKAAELGSLIASFFAYSQAIAAGTVVVLGSAEADRQRAVAAAESATAVQAATAAQVAGNIAAARASVVATEAQVAQTIATQASIVAAREDAVLKLSRSVKDAQAAKAAIEASKAAGFQSFAIRTLQTATLELAAAEQAHATAMTELATLGTQQSRLNGVLLAETRAQTVAQTQLAEAQAAGTATNAAAAATATRASREAAAATAAAAGSTSLLGQAFNAVKGAAGAALVAVARLFVLVNTNPFVFLATTIAAAVAWFVIFGKDLNAGIDQFTTLGDVAAVAGNRIIDSVSAIGEVFVRVFGGLLDVVLSALGPIGVAIADAAKQYAAPFETFFSGVGTGFAGIVRGTARFIDAIAGLLTGLGIAIARAFTGIDPLVMNIFHKLYNDVAGIVESIINTTIDKLNVLRGLVGKSLIEAVKIEKLNVDDNALENYGKSIADSIDAGFATQGGFLENTVVSIFDDATKRAAERAKNNLNEIDLSTLPQRISVPKVVNEELTEKEKRALEKLKNELREVLNQFAPLAGAALELERSQNILNAAFSKGIIDSAQLADYTEALKKHYVDILNPIGKLNREMDEQIALLGLSARERETEAQLLQITKSLQEQGIPITQQEIELLRVKLKLMQSLTETTQIQDELLANSVEVRRKFSLEVQEIQKLLKDPTSEFTKGDALAALQSKLPDLFAGTKEQIDTHQQQFKDMYAFINDMRQADLISEQTATQMKLKVWAQSQQKQLSLASEFFGDLAGLARSSNKKLAKIGKAAAIAQATIDGILAVQKALGAFPPPYNYIAAAAVGITTIENVNRIRNQQSEAGYKTGGYTGDMSKNAIAGTVHGQEYVLNAQTTKRIGVANLDALQSGRGLQRAPRSSGVASGGEAGINVTIQNYGTSKKFDVQHLSENEVRIIARDEADKSVVDKSPRIIAAQLADPNSRVSKAVTRNTNTTRSRN